MSETPPRAAHTADFTFQVGELSTEDLKVVRFQGTEGISELFRFRVELCSPEEDLALAGLVGQPCVLEIAGASGSRFVNGIVRRFERVGEGVSLTHYAAEIVPLHWLLRRRYRSRIYQESNCADMTVPGIVRKVLTDAGVPADAYRFAVQGSYRAREYVVQYRESEFDFISRLMESEGIFYFFEHRADGHTMVIGDSPVAHVPAPERAEFAFRTRTGLVSAEDQEHFYRVRDRHQIRTGAVSLDDFNFEQPPLQLRTQLAAEQFSSLFYHDYPGGYFERVAGERYTQVRLEEFQCARRVVRMTGTVRNLLPGFKYTLREHPNEGLNIEYVVTRLTHRASQPQSAEEEVAGTLVTTYDVDVRAIPADVPYRPARRTPRPVVRGSQTALVTGPAGEEIYTDRYGRVKVQFHWDEEGRHDENSSCWIRVNQGLAGGQYGSMFLPRVGQEVIVDFLEGNPDRPIITGRVYNGDLMPPYGLPDEKTKSCIKTHSSKGGGGTNEIRFEDLKDHEQILIYAQKDLHVRANNDLVENVGHNRHLTVTKNKYELVKESKHVEVKLDYNEKIGGNKSLKVAGNVGQNFSGNYSQQAGGSIFLKSDRDIVIEAATSVTLKVGGNFVKIDSAGVTILGTQTKINSGGGSASGTAVSLTAPEATVAADTATPGRDVTYQAEPTEAEAAAPEQAGRPTEVEERERETSWVEIELVDDAGEPVPGEPYEITMPDGGVRRGNLNQQGQARISLPEPAEVQVSFTRLDTEAWERIE